MIETIETEASDMPAQSVNGLSEITSTDILKFEELLTAELQLPLGWIKYTTGCGGKKLILLYVNQTVEIEGNYHMFQLKNLVIREDMTVQLKTVGLTLDRSDFPMPCFINSIEQLQDFLTMIHRSNVCRGVTLLSEKSGMELHATLRKDLGQTWRHNECLLLLVNDRICPRCSLTKRSLSRTNRRLIKQKATKTRKKTVGLEEQRKNLLTMQARYRSALRVKRLARAKTKTLQSEVSEMRRKIACYGSRDLEQHVNSGNIS